MRPPIDIKSTPGGRYTQAPGPGAFEPIRIRVAPVVCWVGFMLVPFGIVYGMYDSEKKAAGSQKWANSAAQTQKHETLNAKH